MTRRRLSAALAIALAALCTIALVLAPSCSAPPIITVPSPPESGPDGPAGQAATQLVDDPARAAE